MLSQAHQEVDGKQKINMLLAEADNSVGPYGVASHRHTPEIEQICSDLAGYDVKVQFTPHLIPMVRGILATVYGTLRDPGLVREDLLTIYNALFIIFLSSTTFFILFVATAFC